MTKTTIYERIGFGEFAESTITIKEEYTDSNDYMGAFVYVDDVKKASASGTREAIEKALDEKTAAWILKDMFPAPRQEPETYPTADLTIPKAREEAGLTLTKMAKLTGIPLRTIQSWEAGERSCPDWTQKLIIRDLVGWKESKSIFTDKTVERLCVDAKNYKSDEEQKFIDEVGWEDWMEEFLKDEHDSVGIKEVDKILKGIFKEAHQGF